MRQTRLIFRAGFSVYAGNARSQVAAMTLRPGGKEGSASNAHRAADQWLIVMEGTGIATVNGRKLSLRKGSAVIIERGDTHEIRNTGRTLLKTVNVYLPPAYTTAGEELPAGKQPRRRK